MTRAHPFLAASLAAALACVLAACGSSDGKPAASPSSAGPSGRATPSAVTSGSGASPAPTIATETGAGKATAGARIDVTGLTRSGTSMVVLTATITNGGSAAMDYLALSSREGTYIVPSASGVTLIDNKHRQRYFPVRDTARHCLCTPFGIGDGLASGDNVPVTVSFPAPPGDITSLTVDWAGFTPAADVPLS